ncbi:hypothetical protein [Desulfatiglans anilini]|uniref:hypothetical protein n=1 Tax=Desulfatiglans anilini TaxID=90728 RepID=UPI000488B180|nr:hypothetical protein [Desulfatiglans anilini]
MTATRADKAVSGREPLVGRWMDRRLRAMRIDLRLTSDRSGPIFGGLLVDWGNGSRNADFFFGHAC